MRNCAVNWCDKLCFFAFINSNFACISVVSVAQLVARRTHDRKVVGSIPLTQCVSQLSGKPHGVN